MPTRYFSQEYYSRSREALSIGLKTVPVYQAWRQLDPGEKHPIDDRFAALAELTKSDIRGHFPDGLVPQHRNLAEGLRSGEVEWVKTSGTTAEQVTNIWHQDWWNASEAASWKLNAHTAGLDGKHREAILATALSVGFRSESNLSMAERTLGRFLFLNEKAGVREWTDFHYERILAELEAYQPVILEANPSLLARLCWRAQAKKHRAFLPQAIILTYECPSVMQLRSIRKVFPVPIISSYGATETGYVFMQCEHGTLHQNTEFCRVDFQPLARQHGGPALGRILVTTFQHPWVSLIRFDIGDVVRVQESNTCPCGRQEGFMLETVEGRLAHATLALDGGMVTTRQVDDALAEVDGIRDFQLEQRSREDFLLRLAATADQRRSQAARLALHKLYGTGINLAIEYVQDTEPGASGKYQRTRSLLALDPQTFFK